MNKKWLITVGCLIVAVAAVLAVVFLVSTADIRIHTDPDNWQAMLTGNWQVVSIDSTICPNTHMTFQDGIMSQTENDQVTSSCAYEITSTGHLKPTSGEEEYIVEIVSDDFAKLVGTRSSAVYNLIKRSGHDESMPEPDPSHLVGVWTVMVHGGTPVTGETLVITEQTLSLYVEEGNTSEISSTYHCSRDKILSAPDLSLELNIIWIDEGHLCFVDRETGYVWEISKKQ